MSLSPGGERGRIYFPLLDLLLDFLSFLTSLAAVRIKTRIWSKSFAMDKASFISSTCSPPF